MNTDYFSKAGRVLLLGIFAVTPVVVCEAESPVEMVLRLDAARLKARMIGSASRVVTAASARKLGTRAPYRIGPVDLLTALVTEAKVPDSLLTPYRQAGIEVLLVP